MIFKVRCAFLHNFCVCGGVVVEPAWEGKPPVCFLHIIACSKHETPGGAGAREKLGQRVQTSLSVPLQ